MKEKEEEKKKGGNKSLSILAAVVVVAPSVWLYTSNCSILHTLPHFDEVYIWNPA